MNVQSWLDLVEQKLEQRLAEFLRANRYHESLLNRKHGNDPIFFLEEEQNNLNSKAKELRQKILTVSKAIWDWKSRSESACKEGEIELATRADQHLVHLVDQGRQLWEELDHIGKRFKEIEQLLHKTANQSELERSCLEKDWSTFEVQQELEQMKSESR